MHRSNDSTASLPLHNLAHRAGWGQGEEGTRWASSGNELRLDQFLAVVAQNRVGSATILAADDRVIGSYDGGNRYWVDFAGGHETRFARITGALEQAGVPTSVQSQPLKAVVQPVSMLLPILILADVMVILALVAKGGGQLGGFGRAGARQAGEGDAVALSCR